MFDFEGANQEQIEAISTTEGPVLIIAGPGTGKTYTLVQRAIYLILERKVEPEQIFIATFTEKAAKELITRVTNELATLDQSININEMYIGTFHSIFLRIIKENLEYSKFKRNYRILDPFDQQYLIFQNIRMFKNIDNIETVIEARGSWRWAGEICGYVNNLSEELVDVDAMTNDVNISIATLAEVVSTYQKLLEQENLIDFSTLQTECFRLLNENPDILDQLHDKIQYIMVDEYQDTNYIQEQIVFLLAGDRKNICVVGDDDQGLYRFRGATIRNILEFPSKFPEGDCKIISLVVNYRSDSDIIDFYNEWITTTSGSKYKFSWDQFRYRKNIVPHDETTINSSCVVQLTSVEDEDKWHECILSFIRRLKNSAKLTDYNQIAFLFNSVRHPRVTSLAAFLEDNGINVYSPRSEMFFKRNEIKLSLGCLMLMFPKYVRGLENGEYKYLKSAHYSYYKNCIQMANKLVTEPGSEELLQFIRQHGTVHVGLTGTTDYAYSGLLYQLFMYEPFRSILDADLGAGVVDIRPTRNLALLTQTIGKYEYLHKVDVLNGDYINKDTELLFNLYFRLLIDGGIREYEDNSEYAPSGCVSFLTIHQSKGMEFPIVFVDSLSNVPKKSFKDLMVAIEKKYFHRPAFEPVDEIKYFDFWRLYYTAFSRAQDLLILTCNKDNRTPSKYFSDIYCELPNIDKLNLSEFAFKQVKDVNIKDTFSFTSHISVYETCSLQYKFYKELEFMPVRQGSMIFGTLVHDTIEDIHRAALRGEAKKITSDNISNWFTSNYVSLVKKDHGYLAEPQLQAALKQVIRYAERQAGRWDTIKQAEIVVSLVQPDYIIAGKIDLIKGDGDTIELIDFKAERKPDLVLSRDRLEHYRRQLHIYAYLIEERTGQKVSKMNLYYTGEESGNPIVSFPYTKSAIEGTVAAVDDTVHRILKKDFASRASDPKVCANCDFRFYCNKN